MAKSNQQRGDASRIQEGMKAQCDEIGIMPTHFQFSQICEDYKKYENLQIIRPSGKYAKKSLVIFAAVILITTFLTGIGFAFVIKSCYEHAFKSIYYPNLVCVAVMVQAYISGYLSSLLCGRVMLMQKIRNPRIVYWIYMACLLLAYGCVFYVWQELNLFNENDFPELLAYHSRLIISELSWICYFFGLIGYMATTTSRIIRYAETPFSEVDDCWLIKERLSKAIPWLTAKLYRKFNMGTIQFHDLLHEHATNESILGREIHSAQLFILRDDAGKIYNNLIMIEYSTQRTWCYLGSLTCPFRRVIRQIVCQLNNRQFDEFVLHFGPVIEK